MWSWIIILSVSGLIWIFYSRYKEAKKLERIKVKASKKVYNEFSGSEENGGDVKRSSLDYKAIHDAYNKGDLLLSQGDIENAQKMFVQVLSLFPDHIESNNKIGLIYLEKNELEKAQAIFKRLTELNPKNPIAHMNLGLSLKKQGHLEEARQAYERAVFLSPGVESLYIDLGQVYEDLEQFTAAINTYSRAIELNIKHTELYFRVVAMLERVGALNEALAYLNTLLEVQPYNKEAVEKIRELKIKMGVDPLAGKKATDLEDQQIMF